MDAATLVELERIARCKYRYLRCLDQKRWDELADTLTADVTAEYSGGAYRFRGRDEVLAFLGRTLGSEEVLTSHRVHQPEVDLDGPDRATGIWAMDDVVVLVAFDLTVRGAGFYEDRYVRDGAGVWRISHTGYRRTYEEVQPRSPVQGLRLTASWWGTDGRSTLQA